MVNKSKVVYSKKFLTLALFFVIICLSNTSWGQKVYPLPSKDPRIRFQLDPSKNLSINPDITSSIHPKFVARLNPAFNVSINPDANPALNPLIQPALNPNLNNDIHPDVNPKMNPLYTTANEAFLYTPDLVLQEIWMISDDKKIILRFDTEAIWIGFYVSNGEGGYNGYDKNAERTGDILCANGEGGYNRFSKELDWIGFSNG
jgi:hypothetical protein